MADRVDWDRIDALKYQDEAEACRALLARTPLSPEERRMVERDAAEMVRAARRSAPFARYAAALVAGCPGRYRSSVERSSTTYPWLLE